MQDTLYYQDPYLQSFDAVVTGCSPAGTQYAVTLSDTAFYPEGGGQRYCTSCSQFGLVDGRLTRFFTITAKSCT